MEKLRKLFSFSNLINALIFSVAIWMLLPRIPVFVNMLQKQGQIVPSAVVQVIDGAALTLPLKENHVLVFWATWCAPCKVELTRLNKMIIQGDIKASQVVAVASDQDLEIIKSTVKENNYQFTVATDSTSEIFKKYQVSGTPTIVLINEKGAIEWMTMGVSPSLEFRIKNLFNGS